MDTKNTQTHLDSDQQFVDQTNVKPQHSAK